MVAHLDSSFTPQAKDHGDAPHDTKLSEETPATLTGNGVPHYWIRGSKLSLPVLSAMGALEYFYDQM